MKVRRRGEAGEIRVHIVKGVVVGRQGLRGSMEMGQQVVGNGARELLVGMMKLS